MTPGIKWLYKFPTEALLTNDYEVPMERTTLQLILRANFAPGEGNVKIRKTGKNFDQ